MSLYGGQMAGVEVRLLLWGQRDLLFQGRQPGGKGFSEKVLVRIDPVALTGFQDPVDGGIRGTQARIGLLVFKFQDLGVISIGLGQKVQVVLHVL